MTIKKTKTGYRISIRYPGYGPRIRKTLKGVNRSQALEYERRLKLDNGQFDHFKINKRDYLLVEAANEYLRIKSTQKAPSSQLIDSLSLKEFLNEFPFVTKTSSIRLQEVDAYISNRMQNGHAPSTINRRLNSLKAFFKWLERDGYIKQGFTSQIKRLRESVREARRLSDQEIDAMLNNSSPRLRLQIQFASLTGMRPIEIVNLRWENINFETSELIIGGDGLFSTKNGRSRTLPIPASLLTSLKSWIKASDWIFPDESNTGPQRRDTLTRSWIRTKFRAGIKNANFYDLRATAASRLAEQGYGDAIIAKVLGHTTTAMARRYSNKISNEVVREGIRMLEASYNDKVRSQFSPNSV